MQGVHRCRCWVCLGVGVGAGCRFRCVRESASRTKVVENPRKEGRCEGISWQF